MGTTNENVNIVLRDRVDPKIAKKIAAIDAVAIKTDTSLKKLQKTLQSVNVSALNKLSAAQSRLTNSQARLINAQSRAAAVTLKQQQASVIAVGLHLTNRSTAVDPENVWELVAMRVAYGHC